MITDCCYCCSVNKSCPNLWDPLECSTPGSSVLHYFPEMVQIRIHWVGDANCLTLCCPLFLFLQSFPASGSFPASWLFASRGQSIAASASASLLPINIQGWFPLGLTGLFSLLSRGLSRVFSSSTIWKHQFFGTQPFFMVQLSHCTWLLGKL